MSSRRVDRVEQLLRAMGGRARLSQLLEGIRKDESNPDVQYSTLYIAVQTENKRLEEEGERAKFVTSREGEERGWVRLQEQNIFPQGSDAGHFEHQIRHKNESIDAQILSWLEEMDWRQFESTFLSRVLEALGFQDVQVTQATRDGGADARVAYRRGIVEAKAIVSAKRWKSSRTIGVEEVRMLRGIKGDEDTAIIITTASFTLDATTEAKPGQNQRIVYLVDGTKLVDICKRNQIGVKKVVLPELLILDPEVARNTETETEATDVVSMTAAPPQVSGIRRFRDEMLGDGESGLTADEIADLTGYAVGTVRTYLSSDRRKALGDAIRSDEAKRAKALQIVTDRRELTPRSEPIISTSEVVDPGG